MAGGVCLENLPWTVMSQLNVYLHHLSILYRLYQTSILLQSGSTLDLTLLNLAENNPILPTAWPGNSHRPRIIILHQND